MIEDRKVILINWHFKLNANAKEAVKLRRMSIMEKSGSAS